MILAHRVLPTAVVLATLAGAFMQPGIAAAADCDMAEKLRLSEEAKKLAQRNAWAGVERSFAGLVETKCELKFTEYELGAQSARFLGKSYEMYERLVLAKDLDPTSEILDLLSGLDGNYGRVEIKGDARRRPVLTRQAMPFPPDQRKSIEWAIEVVAGTGSFKGMLPAGDYVVGDIEFSVAPGEEWQVVEVGKQKGGGSGGGGDAVQSEGFINYTGLVAMVGPGLLITPEPGKPVTFNNGQHQFAPHDISASGAMVQVGGEIGLTYRAPEMGVAALVGYQGGYGNDTLHAFSGWLAGVMRPGQLRIAVGPKYQAVGGKGQGVAQWFDVGQDPSRDSNEQLRNQGWSWGGGAEASVGYGLIDLDKLRGGIELGGGWMTDGSRNFTSIGLRVGVFPNVPRFEG
jgi:hypothetical protein